MTELFGITFQFNILRHERMNTYNVKNSMMTNNYFVAYR